MYRLPRIQFDENRIGEVVASPTEAAPGQKQEHGLFRTKPQPMTRWVAGVRNMQEV